MKLTKDTYAIGIHAVTGQQTEEGTLAAGTLVRAVETEPTVDGGTRVTFEASTDGGATWYQQFTFGALATE